MVDPLPPGLPPAALRRRERHATARVRTSLLSAPAAVALSDVGLDPVGEAMGCVVVRIGFAGGTGCSWGTGGGYRLATISAHSSVFAGFRPYVSAMQDGYRRCLRRLLDEARALQADGVVGVRLTTEHLDEHTREFVALGTAVRARSRTRPAAPFTTDLSGPETAALLHAGWVPVGIAVGLDVAMRHDDYLTQRQRGWGAGNTEVSGYTDLVQQGRAFARQRFAEQVARLGAQGAVVSDLGLRVWEEEPADGHVDHVAEAHVRGTAVSQFRRSSSGSPSLTILPLAPRR
ncbi:putative heavy-metal-binding protein [Motilibacter rhizosphaerae]|uniref:Putative heavy-metal-binding protein n=1 Tax=Motilibacter rhizosphaerae TaxID=598652 RepID=A0A4Q7NRA3_9ACTN|nr:heavy metal-binding domain-containing protein [Motilibacter rhizosphaerae]RZS89603.1 putative heavy-metal-binding protein [Motilibacter rhizosphaerae]